MLLMFRYFTRLPYADRLSALPLIPALLSYDADSATYADFDQKTARQVFIPKSEGSGCLGFRVLRV
jgi:hypothetical protein